MKIRMFASALDNDNVGDNNFHAAGLVSSMIVSSAGLCSIQISHPLRVRMLLDIISDLPEFVRSVANCSLPSTAFILRRGSQQGEDYVIIIYRSP